MKHIDVFNSVPTYPSISSSAVPAIAEAPNHLSYFIVKKTVKPTACIYCNWNDYITATVLTCIILLGNW